MLKVYKNNKTKEKEKSNFKFLCCYCSFILTIFTRSVIIPEAKYSKALEMLENGQYDEAEEAFAAMNYKNSADMVLESKTRAEMSILNNLSENNAGDIIVINEQNWIVLKKDSGKLLVIAEESILKKCYNETYDYITWESCTLRKYLNEDYYDTFSETAKQYILEVDNQNPNNAEYGTRGGNVTKDKIFLLSIDEADTLMTKSQRNIFKWWWLRSPGELSGYGSKASFVAYGGDIDTEGNFVPAENDVRPAMWLKFDE